MPVFLRYDMEPKDCLIHRITVYFSHPHIRLNLHLVARCDMGNLHLHLRDLISPQEDQEACQVQKALLHVCTCHPSPQLRPRASMEMEKKMERSYLCTLLFSCSNYGMSEF